MNATLKVSAWCYAIAITGSLVWGFVFLFRGEFMPYHATAVGMNWEQVPPGVQALILGFMKLVGAAWITVALSILVLIWFAFRDANLWAILLIPALIFVHYGGVLNAMWHVSRATPASPPWVPTLVGLALAACAALLTIPNCLQRAAQPAGK